MLPSVVEWIGTNLKELIPVRTIRPYQKGVKYTFGRIGGFADWWNQRGPLKLECHTIQYKSLKLTFFQLIRLPGDKTIPDQLHTGWHWFMPFCQSVDIVDTEAEGLDLQIQSITTKDFKQVTFSANIEFETKDAVAYYNNVQNLNVSLENTARVFCARKVRKWTLEEAVTKQDELEYELKTELHKKAKKWGIKILDVGMTDFVESKHFRVFGGDSPIQKLLNA